MTETRISLRMSFIANNRRKIERKIVKTTSIRSLHAKKNLNTPVPLQPWNKEMHGSNDEEHQEHVLQYQASRPNQDSPAQKIVMIFSSLQILNLSSIYNLTMSNAHKKNRMGANFPRLHS